jgi:hypothetical protein
MAIFDIVYENMHQKKCTVNFLLLAEHTLILFLFSFLQREIKIHAMLYYGIAIT